MHDFIPKHVGRNLSWKELHCNNLKFAWRFQSTAKEVYIPLDEKQQIQPEAFNVFFFFFFANVNPRAEAATLSRKLLCVGIAQCFKMTAVPGLSSGSLKLGIDNWITCYSKVLRMSGSLRNHWSYLNKMSSVVPDTSDKDLLGLE